MHDAGITISNSDLKRLLACANADAALLYLYLAAGNDPAQAQTIEPKISRMTANEVHVLESAVAKPVVVTTDTNWNIA